VVVRLSLQSVPTVSIVPSIYWNMHLIQLFCEHGVNSSDILIQTLCIFENVGIILMPVFFRTQISSIILRFPRRSYNCMCLLLATFSLPIFIKVDYINQVIHEFMYLVLFIVVVTVRLCGDIL
jgi:hypothetical protein